MGVEEKLGKGERVIPQKGLTPQEHKRSSVRQGVGGKWRVSEPADQGPPGAGRSAHVELPQCSLAGTGGESAAPRPEERSARERPLTPASS